MEEETKCKLDVCREHKEMMCSECKSNYKDPFTPTEPVTEDKLQDEFMEFWDSKKDILGLGNYSDAVLKFWVDKMELAYKKGVEDVKKHLQVECLDYCEQQNGLDHCKNCGLSIDLIDEMK